MSPVIPDEDENFGGSLALDFQNILNAYCKSQHLVLFTVN